MICKKKPGFHEKNIRYKGLQRPTPPGSGKKAQVRGHLRSVCLWNWIQTLLNNICIFKKAVYLAWKNLSWTTWTARSASVSSTRTETLISLVEIMLMLMPAS